MKCLPSKTTSRELHDAIEGDHTAVFCFGGEVVAWLA